MTTSLYISPFTDLSSNLSLSEPIEKQALLACELLHSESIMNNILIHISDPPTQTTIYPLLLITFQETEVAFLKTKNSASGNNSISLAIIKLAWPKIKKVTYILFRRSLETS